MARRIKPDLPVVEYHVTTRVAQQEFLMDDEIKTLFSGLLDTFAKIYHVEILDHSLLSNHYHLVLKMFKPKFDQTDIKRRHQLAQARLAHPRSFYEEMAQHFYERYTDLSMFMWDFNSATAKAYNKKKGKKGHFWGARFNAEVIEDGNYLLNAVGYVELNAVRAKIVENPVDYPHCTAGKIKRELDAGNEPHVAPIGFLAQVIEKKRAETYLEWIAELTRRYHDPSYRNQPTSRKLAELLGNEFMEEIDLVATMDHMEERKESKQRSAVYGSEEFKKKVLGPSFRERKNHKQKRNRGDPSAPN